MWESGYAIKKASRYIPRHFNQDISIWAGRAEGTIFWDRCFSTGDICEVILECQCTTLGPNLYEVQAAVSEENDRYYGEQRMLHWQDEAAFFQVSTAVREYHFGGVCDLKMKAIVING